jgi:transcriptional regulator with XRE-family HTH domain
VAERYEDRQNYLSEDWRLGVAANLREIRKNRGLTQVGLAKAAGIAQGTISKIERSGQPLSFHNLYRLAWGLQCEISSLLPPHSEDATHDLRK